MAKRLLTLVAAVAVVAVLVPVSVPVQASQMNCRIPFSFVVNGKTLPPGLYTFSTDHSSVLIVRGLRDGAIVLTNGLQKMGDMELKAVFEKSGDRYELREAWMGSGLGRELPKTRWDGAKRIGSTLPVERIVIRGM